jgi:uncharacterized membrane protein
MEGDMDDISREVVMECTASYKLGRGALKAGKVRLTRDRFSVMKTSQLFSIIGMLAGVLAAILALGFVLGFESGSYVSAALRGCLSGLIGGSIGTLIGQYFDKKRKTEETIFSVALGDIVSVNDGRAGLRTTLEVRAGNGELCILLLSRREALKSALSG